MLIFGDCLDKLKEIESDTINLILIDPPYLISRNSNFKNYSDKTPNNLRKKYNFSLDFGEWDKEELKWDYIFSEYYRVLKKGGTIIVFYDIWKSNEIKFYAEKNKFKQPRVGQWQKLNPVPINSKRNYLSNGIEFFFSFVKGGKPTFNSEYDKGIYEYPICKGKERTKHPTQKPIGLFKELIKKHTNPGDTVLDTFAGSGTTAMACKETNRKWIMIEKDENYINIINKRLEK